MKVILIKDIKNVGKKDDIIEVKDNYALNFLIPKQYAIAYNKANKKQHDAKQAAIQAAHLEKQTAALALKKVIESLNLVYSLHKFNDHVAHRVSVKKILSTLEQEHQLILNKKQILLKQALSKAGNYEIKIKLYGNISALLKITVDLN